jgi:hypothetical protein
MPSLDCRSGWKLEMVSTEKTHLLSTSDVLKHLRPVPHPKSWYDSFERISIASIVGWFAILIVVTIIKLVSGNEDTSLWFPMGLGILSLMYLMAALWLAALAIFITMPTRSFLYAHMDKRHEADEQVAKGLSYLGRTALQNKARHLELEAKYAATRFNIVAILTGVLAALAAISQEATQLELLDRGPPYSIILGIVAICILLGGVRSLGLILRLTRGASVVSWAAEHAQV